MTDERVLAAIALTTVADELVPDLRHDFGLVALDALDAAGYVIVPKDRPDALDGARAEYRECMEVRRLLGYLWNATGKNHLRPVHDLFDENDPIVEDVERLAIFDAALSDGGES